MNEAKFPKCQDSRECFARGERGGCMILTHSYPDGCCPFCKEEAEVTDGKFYPWDPYYGESHKEDGYETY